MCVCVCMDVQQILENAERSPSVASTTTADTTVDNSFLSKQEIFLRDYKKITEKFNTDMKELQANTLDLIDDLDDE